MRTLLEQSLDNLGYDRFVVVDTESTGFTPNVYSKLIQIAAVKIINGEVTETFNRYVNPHLKTRQVNKEIIYTGEAGIPKKIRDLTGITDQTIAEQERKGISTEENDVIRDFWEFANDECVLVMHNAPHDIAFLDNAGKGIGIVFSDLPVIDTVPLAKEVYPERKSIKGGYKLEQLCNDLGIPDESHHNALNDCIVTGKLLKLLKDNLKRPNRTWTDLKPYHYKEEELYRISRISPWRSKDDTRHRVYLTLWKGKETATVYYDFDRKRWDQKDGTIKVYQFDGIKDQVSEILCLTDWNFSELERTAGRRSY